MYPHEIEIKEYKDGQDDYGEIVKEWTTLGSFDAEVITPSGEELIEAQKLENPLDYTVYMDYDSRIKADMRVQFKDMILDIHAPLPTMPDFNGDYETLILKCSSKLKLG